VSCSRGTRSSGCPLGARMRSRPGPQGNKVVKTSDYVVVGGGVVGTLAQSAGAEIWDHTPVEAVVRSGDRVERIETSRGEVTPRKAILFAAGYRNLVFSPELRAKTRVTREQMLIVRPDNPGQDDFRYDAHADW
jgi:hypothetical protein